MAFEIGQRVHSRFMGDGTVVGELHKDEDRICLQRISFDSPLVGEKDYEIRKLNLIGGEQGAKVEVTSGP